MKTYVIAILAVLALAACKSEIDNKPAAQVEEPAATNNAEAKADAGAAAENKEPAAEAKEVALQADQSSIEWVGAKVTGDHKGGFKTFTGKGMAAGDALTMVSFEVDTTSVHSDAEKLTGHLKSADFFDVEKHPKATFTSKEIKAAAGEGQTHTVTGDMTIRGVTKTITFPATITKEGDVYKASTEFTLKRFDFGIEYKGKADDLIKDDVLMKINLTYKG